MRLSDIMTPHVQTISPSRSVAEAMEEMHRAAVHHLVVLEDGQAVGVLSANDCDADPEGNVADAMSDVLVTASPRTTLREAANLMRGRSIGCLPVFDHDRLVGIVTISDLLEMIGRGATRPIEESTAWTVGRKPSRPTKRH